MSEATTTQPVATTDTNATTEKREAVKTFPILEAVFNARGQKTREQIAKELNMNPDTLKQALSGRVKKLMVTLAHAKLAEYLTTCGVDDEDTDEPLTDEQINEAATQLMQIEKYNPSSTKRQEISGYVMPFMPPLKPSKDSALVRIPDEATDDKVDALFGMLGDIREPAPETESNPEPETSGNDSE